MTVKEWYLRASELEAAQRSSDGCKIMIEIGCVPGYRLNAGRESKAIDGEK